ncbi:Uma2 family endonuclease [Planotetraspora sp. A-T 1434]|uniref:Uma2 family endonuclease n=1 Tax=Planotetraspora sp. A-T 1434 TaxID=2979219 RepID=UPI0021C0A5AF|nr:Uma2 family endonuclease [Planotetraspora sp. A-T 1434]MCT9929314.1 Uma2 family endonuclease [Planotetraspora sp. A-T 1434]
MTRTIDFGLHRIDHPWTRRDTCELPEGFRYEIEDGNLLVSASPALKHLCVAYRLMRILDDAAEEAGLDLISVGPVDVAVPGFFEGYRSPDLATIPGKLAEGNYELLTGDDVLIATEITSKDAITRDMITKRQVYASIGIPFYWVVRLDEAEPRLIVFKLVEGEYRQIHSVRAGEPATISEPFTVVIDPGALVRRRRG